MNDDVLVFKRRRSLLAGLIILALLFERLRTAPARRGEQEDKAEEVVYFRRVRDEE